MRWQQPQGNGDEHDAPTEPLMPIILSPYSASMAEEMIPTPTPQERPFPTQQPLSHPFFPDRPVQAYGPVQPSVYPVLPPSPTYNGRPVGVATPGSYRASPGKPAQARRSSLPLFVGVFFVGVQLLLLVRFMLKLIGFGNDIAWVGVMYTTSDVFVLPCRLLLQNIAIPIPSAFEICTLLAILMYGLLSRLLVRFLKAVLRSR